MRLLAALANAALVGGAAAATGDFTQAVQPFLEQHCNRCHDEKVHKGEFRVDNLSSDFIKGGSAAKWVEVMDRISSGEMPPKKEPKPVAAEAAKVVEWLAARLKEGEAARLAKRERVSFHKLTREEYAHTVRDLLGVTFDYADPTGLSEDDTWNGFGRIGSVLSVSPSHVEKYLAAADTVLAEAFPEAVVEKGKKAADSKKLGRRLRGIDLRGVSNQAELEAQGLADKVRVEMWPGHDLTRASPGNIPVAGLYRMRVQLSGLKPKNGRAPHLAVYAVNLDRMLHEQDVIAPEDKPIIVEFTTHLPAGNVNVRFSNETPGPSNLPRSGRAGNRAFFSTKDGRLPWQMKLTDEAGEPLYPFLIVDWLEWSGPIAEEGPTFAQREYLPAELGGAREKLTKLAERAFRRPVSTEEVDRLVKLVESEVKSGEKLESAMKAACQAVLCAKDFLYLVEGREVSGTAGKGGRLTEWDLASRLSYFLWSTMPDEALFAAARSGKLHEPGELRAQVQRMLRDPKAARFAEAFPRDWLQLRSVGMFPPDKKLYPDYDAYLEKCMVGETTAFFREVLRQNLSLREFLDSNWTMLNARLADHYKLPEVTGDQFQRVSLRPEDHRGGLLTHAAILSLTSDGTRHRPVHRGKWVMESILGKSPPPPPANVPAIEPTPATQPKATLRNKLDAHKKNESCAACHAKIDPLGLAFDNYDAIGRWRTEEVVGDGIGANPKVDASGELIDGRKFVDAAEFRRLLVEDLDKFNAAFIEKLATFALRRVMTVDDRDSLASLAKQSKAADYRLVAVVEALVQSELFQKR
jgi:mono/diheme cytochrome c family protein